MHHGTNKIHSFSLSSWKRDKWIQLHSCYLKVLKKFSIIFSVNRNICKSLKEEYIFSHRESLKEWSINKSIPKSYFSWKYLRIIFNSSYLGFHYTSQDVQQGCFPNTWWSANDIYIPWNNRNIQLGEEYIIPIGKWDTLGMNKGWYWRHDDSVLILWWCFYDNIRYSWWGIWGLWYLYFCQRISHDSVWDGRRLNGWWNNEILLRKSGLNRRRNRWDNETIFSNIIG